VSIALAILRSIPSAVLIERKFNPALKSREIMIDSVDQNPAPKRIALGSDAYGAIHKALTDRLAVLEAQRDLAFSTDLPKA
jgi:hypothetical protein